MRYLRFCVCLCVSVLIQADGFATEPPKIEGDRIAFKLSDVSGQAVSLSDERFSGKVVLVDLWGTWCPPCRMAIPFLVKLHERFGSDGLEIVGIAFEDGADAETRRNTMRAFADANDIQYVLLDGGGSSQDRALKVLPALTEVYGMPTLFVVGRDGTVTYSHTGFDPSDKEAIEAQIKTALQTKDSPDGESSQAK